MEEITNAVTKPICFGLKFMRIFAAGNKLDSELVDHRANRIEIKQIIIMTSWSWKTEIAKSIGLHVPVVIPETIPIAITIIPEMVSPPNEGKNKPKVSL